MPYSADVKLPRDYVAKFPETCVSCREDTFGNFIKRSTRNISWTQWVMWFIPGKKVKVQIPACQECALRMRIRRWAGWFAMAILIGLCWLFVWPLLDNIPRSLRRWAFLLSGVACLSPVFLWEMFWPPAFDMTATKKSITYEFKNMNTAQEFIQLNLDADFIETS